MLYYQFWMHTLYLLQDLPLWCLSFLYQLFPPEIEKQVVYESHNVLLKIVCDSSYFRPIVIRCVLFRIYIENVFKCCGFIFRNNCFDQNTSWIEFFQFELRNSGCRCGICVSFIFLFVGIFSKRGFRWFSWRLLVLMSILARRIFFDFIWNRRFRWTRCCCFFFISILLKGRSWWCRYGWFTFTFISSFLRRVFRGRINNRIISFVLRRRLRWTFVFFLID